MSRTSSRGARAGSSSVRRRPRRSSRYFALPSRESRGSTGSSTFGRSRWARSSSSSSRASRCATTSRPGRQSASSRGRASGCSASIPRSWIRTSSSTRREASGGKIIRRVGEPRLTELPARYNAAETFIDSHRGVRESSIAIRCQGKSVTYGELAGNVDRCGNAYRELGIGLEQRILILCLDSPAFAYAFFGAIKIGAVPVPTNTLLPPRDLAYVLNDSRAVAIVVSAPLLAKVVEIRKDVPRLKHVIVAGGEEAAGVLSLDTLLAAASDELSPADTTPDDPCFWLYSSGTTGFPKGAVHLQHDMVFCADTYGAQVLRTTEADRHFTVSPLFHAYGLGNGVFFPFAVGGSSVYKPERATPDVVYSLITDEKPTIPFTAPTFYASLLAYPTQEFK